MKKEFNNIYIAQENDSIDSIAKKYNTSPIKILIENSITPAMIKKGVYLIIKT